jgi:hypothetical protein
MCGNGCMSRDGGHGFRLCAPQTKIYRFVPFFKNIVFYKVNFGTFWQSGGKHLLAGGKSKKKWK